MDTSVQEHMGEELEETEFAVEIGQKVKIKKITKDTTAAEDYYYLKKFENQVGTIIERNQCRSGIYSYRIEFKKGETGYFYQQDFIIIDNKS